MHNKVIVNKRTRSKLDKKRRIVEAAVKLISERGYHKATTVLIARESGVSQGMIFHYFKNKENLFFVLLKEGSDKLLQAMEEGIKGKTDTIEKIAGVIEAYLGLAGKEEKLFQLLTRQVRSSGVSSKKLARMEVERPVDFLKEIIEQGMREGIIRRMDAEAAVLCLLGMVDYTVLGWMIEGKKFPLHQVSQLITDLFLNGLIER